MSFDLHDRTASESSDLDVLSGGHCFFLDSELASQIEQQYALIQDEVAEVWEQGLSAVKAMKRREADIVESNDLLLSQDGFNTADVWQALPALPQTQVIRILDFASHLEEHLRCFETTRLCVVDADTVTAALAVGDACALNFAGASTPGGRYRLGGPSAQEEALCKQIPQLWPSLKAVEEAAYPIEPGTALLTPGLPVLRRGGTWELCANLGDVNIITAAMPCHDPAPGTPEWEETVTLRIRSVLKAGLQSGKSSLILGAFGCGVFGNPPDLVANIFRQQLSSSEFRGAFHAVVFAIPEPFDSEGRGPNFEAFAQTVNTWVETLVEDPSQG